MEPLGNIRDIHTALAQLQRRDRRVLWGFGLASVLVVVLGEWLALTLDMAARYGTGPILLRAFVYIILSLLLWWHMLANNRRLVERLMWHNLSHYEAILQAYDSAIALKDGYTGGHGRRVARYAVIIAEALELDTGEVEQVRQAALLHDLGKIGIPDAILRKPARLSPEEYATVCRHAGQGADILQAIPALRDLAPAIRHHHERYGGGGYPDHLQGSAIPRAARIIAVADALDAMTSQRAYRPAMSWPAAIAELQRGAATAFDPWIINATTRKGCLERLYQVHVEARAEGRRYPMVVGA